MLGSPSWTWLKILNACTPNSMDNTLGELGFLHKRKSICQVVEGADQPVRSVAKTADQATERLRAISPGCDRAAPAWVERRRSECSGIDLDGVARHSSRQQSKELREPGLAAGVV